MDTSIADGRILPDDDDYWRPMTESELDRETGLSSTSRWRGRKAGWFPQYLVLSPGRKANTRGQIRDWKLERLKVAEEQARLAREEAAKASTLAAGHVSSPSRTRG